MKYLRLRGRVRRALRGRSSGLTLVELVIAMALMSIIVVAFLGGLSNAIAHLHFADVRTTAESLASSEMEYLKQSYQSNPVDYENEDPTGYEGYTVQVSFAPLEDGLQEMVVKVSHGGKEVVSLTGYRGDR